MTDLTNNTATVDTNRTSVCQRSGMKVKPGELVREWTGLWVHIDNVDKRSAQDFVRHRAEEMRGSPRPESADKFITTTIDLG